MCGLILAPNHYSSEGVRRAMDRMKYRGADNERGVTQHNGWHLGHVRLAIQDLSAAGSQPFWSDHKVVAFVGEFFNHNGSEKAFLTDILDSPRLVDFHQADGFWSVIEVGYITKVITDHLGIKPMYWWPEKQIVCSELDPMFELAPKPAFDEVYLSNCVKFGYDYSGRTPYVGIQQLPPGTVLHLTRGVPGGNLTKYWDWSKVPTSTDLKSLVDKAIQNRLMSDREVAMLLSGGLDSSIIYYSLKEAGTPVKAFSVENGESEFLPPGVEVLSLPEVTIEDAVRIMQAPLDLGSLIPQIQLARAVKAAGFNVCLTGDGADELFGGYARAQTYDSQKSDVFCELPYYHLPRLDRVMMHETIELRSPFLAPSVVAAALKLKRADRTTKQALKAAYADIVPKAILERTKVPLKSSAVRENGLLHRVNLDKEFRNV